jgi:sugar/nucleoside kinase (ribokinase family)
MENAKESVDYLIFGPAYLDITLFINGRLIPGDLQITVDQSLAASSMEHRTDGIVFLSGTSGDRLCLQLPSDRIDLSSTYHLAEPVLARLLGPDTERFVVGEYQVVNCGVQLGGMGAGYALAFDGKLRVPIGGSASGPDVSGRDVLSELQKVGIETIATVTSGCASDNTLLLLSDYGDKLAVGVREALLRWQPSEVDHKMVARAGALVFCGAPNRLIAEILSWKPEIPVMCAPAMRNVCDKDFPFVDLAENIDYLTLNSLEWQYMEGKDHILSSVPVVSVTDGPRGSRIYFGGGELAIPACQRTGPVNTNRAGETYGSTFFKVLLHYAPEFHNTHSVDVDIALRAGQIATTQADRQLDITGFAFPSDDWLMDES